MRLSELRSRDIVNLSDGKRLGLVADAEVDLDSGRILALIVPGSGRLFGLLGGGPQCVITWSDVITIGEDVILVRWKQSVPAPPSKSNTGGAAVR
jgi:YlmC/YmxH family sporulation protein